jgi:hypothetical protein
MHLVEWQYVRLDCSTGIPLVCASVWNSVGTYRTSKKLEIITQF